MAMTNNISAIIESELLRWPGVTAGTHRFGGREFRIGKREIGHLHGNRVADLPFPRAIRDELVSRSEASSHHHLPDSGWVSFHIGDEQDVPALLALFRRNYERLYVLRQRDQTDATSPGIDLNPSSGDKESR
jgi:hypothetical protein